MGCRIFVPLTLNKFQRLQGGVLCCLMQTITSGNCLFGVHGQIGHCLLLLSPDKTPKFCLLYIPSQVTEYGQKKVCNHTDRSFFKISNKTSALQQIYCFLCQLTLPLFQTTTPLLLTFLQISGPALCFSLHSPWSCLSVHPDKRNHQKRICTSSHNLVNHLTLICAHRLPSALLISELPMPQQRSNLLLLHRIPLSPTAQEHSSYNQINSLFFINFFLPYWIIL